MNINSNMYYSINFNDKREFDVIPFGGHVYEEKFDGSAIELIEDVAGNIFIQKIAGRTPGYIYVRVSAKTYPNTKAYNFKISDYEKLAGDYI